MVGSDITDGGLPGAGALVQEERGKDTGPGLLIIGVASPAPAPAPLLTDGMSALRSLQAQE